MSDRDSKLTTHRKSLSTVRTSLTSGESQASGKSASVPHDEPIRIVGMSLKSSSSEFPQKTSRDFSQKAANSSDAPTLVFMQGELESRPADEVKLEFDRGISGTNLGENSRVVYWVDLLQPAINHNRGELSDLLAAFEQHIARSSGQLISSQSITIYQQPLGVFYEKIKCHLPSRFQKRQGA